jgi:histidinol-phosphate aminotransferase
VTWSPSDLVREELRTLEAYAVPHPDGIKAKLDANESPFAISAELARGLADALAKVALHRYPDGHARELRAILCKETGVSAANLCLGNGSDELIALLCAAFSRPRTGASRARIAYPVPTFVVYRIASLSHGAQPLEIPLRADFTLDTLAMDRTLVAGRPNVVFFALPNNPTGTLWPKREILRVAKEHPETLVVSDEAYFDYAGETLLGELPAHPNLIIMRTLSKIGMAALRVGYVLAHEKIIGELEKVRPPYNVGALSQAAAVWLLSNHKEALRESVSAVVRERERLFGEMTRRGLEVFPSRANLLLFRVGTPGDGRATALWHTLATRGVLVRNLDRPGPLSGCLRVTVGTADENDRFLSALESP